MSVEQPKRPVTASRDEREAQVWDKPMIRLDHPAIAGRAGAQAGRRRRHFFIERSGAPWLESAGDRRAAYDPLAAGADAMSKSIADE